MKLDNCMQFLTIHLNPKPLNMIFSDTAKLVDTSMLTSTTAEAKMVPPEPALPLMLNVVSVVDVPSPS